MKLQYIAFPAFSLLATVAADGGGFDVPPVKSVEDCFWRTGGGNMITFCPAPKNKGDAYSNSFLKPNDCIRANKGQVHGGDKGDAFESLDFSKCDVDNDKKQLDCGKHGHVKFTDFAKVEHHETGPKNEAKFNKVTCFGHGDSSSTEWHEDVPVDKFKFSN